MGKTEPRLPPPLTHKGLVLLARLLGDAVFAPHNISRDPAGGAAVTAPLGAERKARPGRYSVVWVWVTQRRSGPTRMSWLFLPYFSRGAAATGLARSGQGRAGGRTSTCQCGGPAGAQPSASRQRGPASRQRRPAFPTGPPQPPGARRAFVHASARPPRAGACRWEHVHPRPAERAGTSEAQRHSLCCANGEAVSAPPAWSAWAGQRGKERKQNSTEREVIPLQAAFCPPRGTPSVVPLSPPRPRGRVPPKETTSGRGLMGS